MIILGCFKYLLNWLCKYVFVWVSVFLVILIDLIKGSCILLLGLMG